MRTSIWGLAWVVLLSAGSLLADEPTATAGGPVEPPFIVKGRVVDDGDRPVAGAEVKSLIYNHNRESLNTVTGDDGRFLLELPRKPSRAMSLSATIDGQTRQAFASFRLNDKTELPAEIKLVLRPAREIDVAVVDTHGQAVHDAKVIVHATFYTTEAKTDASGKVVIRVPVDTALANVLASTPGVGFDYVRYQSPNTLESDPSWLPQDHALPLTLVLNGCRQVTVRVVDDGGQPMAGVSVRSGFIEKPKKGGLIGTRFEASTDQDGRATFLEWPIDFTGTVGFLTEAKGYYAPIRSALEPGSEATEITVNLSRLVPVHGQVTLHDGRPAAGAKVRAAGQGYVGNHFHGETKADEHGHFEFEVYHNQFYIFAAVLYDSITPLAARVILDEEPTDEIRLVLQKATHIHGRLTIGPDQRPYAGQRLVLGDEAGDAYGKVPKSDQLPNGDPARINPTAFSTTITDEQGKFEFLGAPGKHRISTPVGVPAPHFELTDEAEFEINLHAERPSQEEFTGRLITQDDPRRGVAKARVTGIALNKIQDVGGMRATSDAQGSFRVNRTTVAMLIHARTEDGSLAGIVRVGPDDRSAVIPVGATASAHGRLIDPTTGSPLRNMEVTYGVSWDGAHSGRECGGSVRSDDRGEFTADGLVLGWQYQFVAVRALVSADRVGGGHWFHLAKMTPDLAEKIDLGEFNVDPSGEAKPASPTARAPMAEPPNIYDTEADGNEQIAAALKTAKAEKKRVLLQFGANWCGWCHKLSDCFKENEAVAASLSENYVVVLIDVNQVGDKKHNADVNERYGNPTRHGLPVLVVLDAEGKLLKTKDTGELEKDGHHDPKKVLAFLNRWKPE